jgi:DNA-binding beta-propeller fold protein YncE
VTSPINWKNYAQPANTIYKPDYPDVDVRVSGGAVVNLKKKLQDSFDIDDKIPSLKTPAIEGIGEVWVDTQYEVSKTKGGAYPSTVTVVDVAGPNKWKAKRKIALHEQKMNNAHNFWASHDQKEIYNTEWQGNSLYVMNRENGALIQELDLVNGPEVTSKGIKCHDPAHVMTRVNNQQVHTGCNGDDGVVELNRLPDGKLEVNRLISVQDPTKPRNQAQPHAHWMGHDGETMVTPNSNTNDSTLFDFPNNKVKAKPDVGFLPIASAINPDSTKYYVSNYLGHSISVIDMKTGTKIKDIPLIDLTPGTGNYNLFNGPTGAPIGGLPIQTPVSPDGKFVITGNTLTGTITIIDTKTDTLVAMVPCDPGCHGVNFGAKKGGGYYAYVTSKFSNRLIVLDYDKNNDGNIDDAEIAGWVVLADANAPIDDPGGVSGNAGMGGQGVLPVPNVYNGWVQKLPKAFCDELSKEQRNPIGTPVTTCPES